MPDNPAKRNGYRRLHPTGSATGKARYQHPANIEVGKGGRRASRRDALLAAGLRC
jgi:hypothetical protein